MTAPAQARAELGATSIDASTTTPAVSLSVAPCSLVDAGRVRDLTGIELKGALLPADAAPPDTALMAAVTCSDNWVRVDVTSAAMDTTASRVLGRKRLHARTGDRLVALTIVELVATLWVDLGLASQQEQRRVTEGPPSDAASAAAPSESSPEPPPAIRRWDVTAVTGARGLFAPSAALFDFDVSAAYRLVPSLALALHVGGNRGSSQSEYGKVLANGASGALFVQGAWEWDSISVTGGVGWRHGFMDLRGRPFTPATVAGHRLAAFWGGPAGMLSVSAQAAAPLTLVLAVEADYLVSTFSGRADQERVLAISGVSLVASAGLGLRF